MHTRMSLGRAFTLLGFKVRAVAMESDTQYHVVKTPCVGK